MALTLPTTDTLVALPIAKEDIRFLRKVAANAEDEAPLITEPEEEKERKKKRKRRTKTEKSRARIRVKYALAAKSASMGPNPQRQFDEAFATMAYTYLQEKAPSLIDHMLGFQTIDRSDDGRRALGMFVFNPGGRILEAPVFFMNGELKGHQLLHIRDANQFVPLRENMLDHVLSTGDKSDGQVGPIPGSSLAIQTPDTQPMLSSGIYGKMGSAQARLRPWAEELGLQHLAEKLAASREGVTKLAKLITHQDTGIRFGLEDLLSTSEPMLKAACHMALRYPSFARGMARHYGKDWASKYAAQVKRDLQASEYMSFPKTAGLLRPGSKTHQLHRVYVYKTAEELDLLKAVENKDELRSSLVNEGIAIEDERMDFEVATPLVLDQKVCWTPTTQSGVYKVPCSDGDKTCLVIPGGQVFAGNKTIIIDQDTKGLALMPTHEVITKRNGEDDDDGYAAKYKSASKPETLSVGKGYLFMLPNGQAAGPYIVTDQLGDDEYEVDSPTYDMNVSAGNDLYPGDYSSCDPGPHISRVCLTRLDRTKFGVGQYSDLLVPDEFKVQELAVSKKSGDSQYTRYSFANKIQPLTASSLSVEELLKKANLVVRRDVDWVINGSRFDKQAAALHLVQTYRLRPKAAFDILRKADHRQHSYLVKAAVPGMPIPEQGIPMPTLPGPTAGDGFVPKLQDQMQMGMEQMPSTAMPIDQSQGGFPEYITPGGGMDGVGSMGGGMLSPEDQAAMEEEQSKEMFESNAISALASTSRIDDRIGRTARSIFNATNSLGELLFLYYAHNDAFVDRFGDEDMESLEDKLITTFENAGDLYVKLRERVVTPSADFEAALPSIGPLES